MKKFLVLALLFLVTACYTSNVTLELDQEDNSTLEEYYADTEIVEEVTTEAVKEEELPEEAPKELPEKKEPEKSSQVEPLLTSTRDRLRKIKQDIESKKEENIDPSILSPNEDNFEAAMDLYKQAKKEFESKDYDNTLIHLNQASEMLSKITWS